MQALNLRRGAKGSLEKVKVESMHICCICVVLYVEWQLLLMRIFIAIRIEGFFRFFNSVIILFNSCRIRLLNFSATMVRCRQWLRVFVLNNSVWYLVFQVWVLFIRLERHCVEAIASCQLCELLQTHAVLHSFMACTVEHIFREPTPNSFPGSVRINLWWV